MTKRGMETWLREQGHWQRFIKIREEMRKDGIPTVELWKQAFDVLQKELISAPLSSPACAIPPSCDPVFSEAADSSAPMPDELRGKACSMTEAANWVATNIRHSSPDAQTCPGQAAWNLWHHYHPMHKRDEFWERIVPRYCPPNRDEIERENRMNDDGRRIIKLMERVERASKEAIAAESH